MENPVSQRLELLIDFGVAVVGRLIAAKAADPDLESGVLLQLTQRRKGVQAAIDLVPQELELATGEVALCVPEQVVLLGELVGKFGLKPIKLLAELAILIQRRT